MKFKQQRIFNYPVDTVTDYFLENEKPAYDMNSLENVTQWKIIKEENVDHRRVGTKEWCAHAQIPPVLQKIVKPEMLTWYEHSVWDRQTKTYSFQIEPFYLKNKVKCGGKTSYTAKGGDKTQRTFEVELHVSIPVLGGVFESLIVQLLKKNEEQDYQLCRAALKKAFG